MVLQTKDIGSISSKWKERRRSWLVLAPTSQFFITTCGQPS